MPGFYGTSSVLASLAKHRPTGKVTAATLTCNTTGVVVPYANAYVWPVGETTGLGAGANATQRATIVLWQVGEPDIPRADDTVTDSSGRTWVLDHVDTRLAADAGYAVHDCTAYRLA